MPNGIQGNLVPPTLLLFFVGRRNVYLGRRVKDVGNNGYDRPEEGMRIADAIYYDYVNGRIDYNTAMSRLNLLELITQRNSKLSQFEKARVRSYIDRVREMLRRERSGPPVVFTLPRLSFRW